MFIFDAVCWQVQARPEKLTCQVDLWAHQTVTFYSPLQTYSSSSLIRVCVFEIYAQSFSSLSPHSCFPFLNNWLHLHDLYPLSQRQRKTSIYCYHQIISSLLVSSGNNWWTLEDGRKGSNSQLLWSQSKDSCKVLLLWLQGLGPK